MDIRKKISTNIDKFLNFQTSSVFKSAISEILQNPQAAHLL